GLLPREQGRGPVTGDDWRGLCGAAPAGVRDPVRPAGDVGREVAGPDSLGCARSPCRLGRRVAIRPGGGRNAAGPRPWGVAGDLSREPPPDPAGRGRGLLRWGDPPRRGRPGQGVAAVPAAAPPAPVPLLR